MKGKFGKNQRGMLLAWVLMLLAFLSILTVAALTLASNQFNLGHRYSSSVKSLHYAEAGIHHYLAYMNSEDSPTRGEPLPLDEDIPYEDGFYRLKEIDKQSGHMVLRSTGWNKTASGAKSDPRTIDMVLKKRTFTEFGYFSDDDGSNIWLTSSDKIYGPYHTNSNLHIKGNPTFYSPVSFANRICYNRTLLPKTCKTEHTGRVRQDIFSWNDPDFRQGIVRTAPIALPETNVELKSLAQNGGLYLYGMTCIKLDGNDGIIVRNHSYNNGASTRLRQGDPDFPANGVIYVDGLGAPQDKFLTEGGNAFVAGMLKGRLTIAAKNDIYITGKDPTQWIPTRKWYEWVSFYQDKYNGIDVGPFIGIKYANTTFTPIIEDGDIIGYDAQGNDMLGLIAERDIKLLTSGWFLIDGNTQYDKLLWSNVDSNPKNDVIIYAALFAVNGSFENPAYWRGILGKDKSIIIRGSIIQKYRGKMGLDLGDGIISAGFDKDFAHDNRMLSDSPPHFLVPEESGWEIVEWIETRDHLTADEGS